MTQEEKQPSKDLEEAAKDFVEKNSPYTDEFMLDNEVEEAYKIAELTFKRGAQWQKEQSTKLLKTIYSDCDNLKNDLDRVTTGNLPHCIGNIKFSITGMQVLIKQEMEEKQ